MDEEIKQVDLTAALYLTINKNKTLLFIHTTSKLVNKAMFNTNVNGPKLS